MYTCRALQALAFLITTSLSYGCGASPPLGVSATVVGLGSAKIQHVVYIVQENRSFDDLFQGYPGADTMAYGKTSHGGTIRLKPISLKTIYFVDHSAAAMFAACNGTANVPGTKCRMNGFGMEQSYGAPPNGQYAYVPHRETKPYFDMAHEWVLADRMFASQLDESFVAHQYIIAAQADSSVDIPSGSWGCNGGNTDKLPTLTQLRRYGPLQRPCFNYKTLGDEFDAAGLTWRFYTSKYDTPSSGNGSLWSAYQAIAHIYRGPDWKTNIVTPQKRFLTDVTGGKLANFTWITPICANSDHMACGGGYGPSWVSALVNAIGESKFWETTAIFVQLTCRRGFGQTETVSSRA